MDLIGDHRRARAYAQQGLELAVKAQFRPEQALLRLQLAELEASDGRRDDAHRLLEQTIAELESMHMWPGFERAQALCSRWRRGAGSM
jgi:hypothetical protein